MWVYVGDGREGRKGMTTTGHETKLSLSYTRIKRRQVKNWVGRMVFSTLWAELQG